jgi:uncharacterized protein YegP (UPF0339 family)
MSGRLGTYSPDHALDSGGRMPGKFVIKKGRTGQFRFSLVGRNGQIVATSETYTTKASCLNGVKAVKTLAADAAIEDQTSKEWAAQQAGVKAKAATRRATKTAAKAAKKAISEAGPAKKVGRTAKKAGFVPPGGTAT